MSNIGFLFTVGLLAGGVWLAATRLRQDWYRGTPGAA